MNPAQKKAIKIATRIMHSLRVRAGQREKDLARLIQRQFKLLKVKPAFPLIVASGKRSANPHARPSKKVIKNGEQVIIDLGVKYKGYCSDITRTFLVGRVPSVLKNVFRVIKNAQKRAIKAIKAGVSCREIDLITRHYIQKQCSQFCPLSWSKCRGDCFIHSTGHGVGKKVHQEPRISLKNRKKLKPGMVITVEPGIYFKGWGGVRIEDMVLVTKRGGKVLT